MDLPGGASALGLQGVRASWTRFMYYSPVKMYVNNDTIHS